MSKLRTIISTIAVVVALPACASRHDMQALNEPHFKVGEHAGAEFCGSCHPQIYQDWSQRSSHATAVESEAFAYMRNKFNRNIILKVLMDDQMCFACHGDKEQQTGIDCETCHGPALPNVPIEVTHEQKYAPGLTKLQAADFCRDCHNMESGSGDVILSLYSEWQQSPAAQEGVTCQDCHMDQREEGTFRYHGFDSMLRVGVHLYQDYLKIRDVSLDSPRFSLVLENRVEGHAVPATGPSRFLVLDVSFYDDENNEVYHARESYGKYFTMVPLVGIFPDKEVKNTQLQAGESRQIEFSLPDDLERRISHAAVTLRFMDVADWFQGDLTKAHWVSDPILEQEVHF